MKRTLALVAALIAGSLILAPNAFADPKTVIEEVGMPASGSCADVVDTDLAYGTGLTGNWKPGFGMWMNGGKGGPICGRSLVYNNALKKWTFGN
jgi:hypothetical protein